MKLIGTLSDWLNHKPDAYLRRPKMQKGVCIKICEHVKDGRNTEYPSNYPDGSPSLPFFGPQCPYIVTGKVNWFCFSFYGGSGGQCVISNEYADEEVWYEVDPMECYQNKDLKN